MIRKYAELSEHPTYFKWQWPKDPATFEIKRVLQDALWTHDADNCGSSLSFWALVHDDGSTTFLKCYHSWDIDYDPEWNLVNDFTFTDVTRDEMLYGKHPECSAAEYAQKYAAQNLIYVV